MTKEVRKHISWHYVSETDLVLLKDWYYDLPVERPKHFRNLLFLLGADPNYDWDERFCIHRNRQGEIVRSRRFEFVERSDEAWLNSGFASEEAVIYAYDM